VKQHFSINALQPTLNYIHNDTTTTTTNNNNNNNDDDDDDNNKNNYLFIYLLVQRSTRVDIELVNKLQ